MDMKSMVMSKDDNKDSGRPGHSSRRRRGTNEGELSAQRPRRLFQKADSDDESPEKPSNAEGFEPEPELPNPISDRPGVQEDDDDLKLGQFSRKDADPTPCTPPPRKIPVAAAPSSAETGDSLGSQGPEHKEIPDAQTMLEYVSEELRGCCPTLTP